jgi:hypothetical protein
METLHVDNKFNLNDGLTCLLVLLLMCRSSGVTCIVMLPRVYRGFGSLVFCSFIIKFCCYSVCM